MAPIRWVWFSTALLFFCGAERAIAQTGSVLEVNPTIRKIVAEVSSDNIRMLVDKLASFGTRHTLSDTVSTTRGIGAARRWIKSEFEKYAAASGGRMKVAFHEALIPASRRIPHPTNLVNVVATLNPKNAAAEGPKRFLVVGGHYDSRAADVMDAAIDAPGANDDGSGTAVTMELARVLSRHNFDATIVFIAFAGEEQGLLGATAWAEMARANGWNLEAMLNNDMVGSTRNGLGEEETGAVRLYAEALTPLDTGSVLRSRNSLGLENDGLSRTLARHITEVGKKYVPDFDVRIIYRRDRFLRGGDHTPFHERGFAAVRFVEVKENYDHQHQNVRVEGGKQYGDLPQFVDYEYAGKIAKVNAAVVASLASAPAPPKNVGLVTSQLGYKSTLRWEKNPELDVAGYVVRYRETTSLVWQGSVFTADTTITVDQSKDDYLFGVQAVDREGNVSLVITPRPVQ
ncbi:MAG: M20/M25/M40 family metallo-hydrolase [Ignavibacteria bacterium]|nr:M20/M25/M40 family metallo-hydrolase [Ignavibacteria bacterium]